MGHPRTLGAVLRWLLLVLAAAVVTAAAVATGMFVDDEPDSSAQPRPAEVRSTPLEDVDTSTLAVQRTDFCDGVPSEAVAAALGAEPEDQTPYGNGEKARLDGRDKDVAHEFGCSWTPAPARPAPGCSLRR